MRKVTIIGGGLAGSEAAYQASKLGVDVELHEMRPVRMTKAHKTEGLAELVCSNSFRGADLSNAVGLLKEELKCWDSLIMRAALKAEVPAGGALAVDREVFSKAVTTELENNPLITIHREEVLEIPEPHENQAVIIATGPLTSPSLSSKIQELTGQSHLSFYDAISPIILKSSINESVVFRQSRYDKGDGADYLNIPLDKEQYETFIHDLLASEKYGGHDEVESDSIEGIRPFEGCMPIEDMAERGIDTLRHGPLKPKGLTDPRTQSRPYAVVQLRQDNTEGTIWSFVGFQTRMKQGEQSRILRSLPGLENAEFVRMGSVHRNTFIDSPKCLDLTLQYRRKPGLFFAGQITGTEGYVESTSGGLIAGLNAARHLLGLDLYKPKTPTAIGSLLDYISDPGREYFQPMNISFGLMQSYTDALASAERKIKDKKALRRSISEEALRLTQTEINSLRSDNLKEAV